MLGETSAAHLAKLHCFLPIIASVTMSTPNLVEIHDVLIDIARQAGDKITSAHPSVSAIDTKKNSSDLVTETDKAVEDLVSATLKTKYPSYSFLGEETYQPGMRLTEAPTFVCDPIDGTTNFVHAHPYVSISLAFVDNKVPLVGVVYNPFLRELYHAVQGHGAYLTRVPTSTDTGSWTTIASLKSSQVTQKLPLTTKAQEPLDALNKTLIAVEWGNERSGNNWEVKVKTFAALAGDQSTGGAMAHSLRSLGSAALNLCGVAAGHLDVYWEGGCWAWDVAAGMVVLNEAGGYVVGGNPGEWEVPVDIRRYLAVRASKSGRQEQKNLIEEFWSCVKGTLEYDL